MDPSVPELVEAPVLPDPSTADGFSVVYDREVALEIRQSEDPNQDTGQLQMVKLKVLMGGGDDEKHQIVRIECSSEADLFFHYYHTLDTRGFVELQQRQKLMIAFMDYSTVISRMCNNCIDSPHTHMAVMYLYPNGSARLDFVQNMEYKFVELLSLDFLRSPDELTRQHITYRYASMKRRVAVLSARLQEVNEIVKLKNPSLLLQIQRPASGVAPGTSFKKAGPVAAMSPLGASIQLTSSFAAGRGNRTQHSHLHPQSHSHSHAFK